MVAATWLLGLQIKNESLPCHSLYCMKTLHVIGNFANVGNFISVFFFLLLFSSQSFLVSISPVAKRLTINFPLGRNKKMASALFIYYSFS